MSSFARAAVAQAGPPPQLPAAVTASGSTTGSLPPPANSRLPTLFLVGNFALRSGQGGPEPDIWGERLISFFDTSRINVDDGSRPGSTIRSYLAGGDWAAVLAVLKPGDVVLLQFGPEAVRSPGESVRSAASLPGVGDDLRELPDPSLPQVVHSYGWYLREFVDETIARGAAPILCSPASISRDGAGAWKDEQYAGWTRRISIEQRVGYLDLQAMLPRQIEAASQAQALGQAEADRVAAAAIAALKGLPHNPLAGYLSNKATGIAPYRPPTPALTRTP